MNLAQAFESAVVEPHVRAVLDRIRDDEELADSTFEGDVSGDPERYANVYHDTGFRSGHDLHNHQVDVEITFTVHGVGQTREQAVWVADRVAAQLLSYLPAVPGRRCWRLRHDGSQPVQRDDDVIPPKFFTADRWVLRSTPRKETP